MYWKLMCPLIMIGCLAAGSAASQSTQPAAEDADIERSLRGSVEKASATFHQLQIDDEPLACRATAANMLMKDEAGKLKATMFFIAYDRLTAAASRRDEPVGDLDLDADAADPAQPGDSPTIAEEAPAGRPITFVFNGGPGAAAVWLHLGTAGPQRILLDERGFPPPPPHELVENQSTWLTFTDLVFIDPVGTGFSRAAEGEKTEQFYGVTEDIKWVSEFIRLYLTLYKRWSSPKFLAGESYGTTRAAGLSDHLVQRHGVALNGIILISSVLSFQTIRFGDGNDLAYVLYLPTYAAIAHYHGRLGEDPPPLDQLLPAVERWALTEYSVALARGDALPGRERERVAERLAQYTGLDFALILKNNLRISASTFQKHLLADQRAVIGRFDGRVVGFDLNPAGGWPSFDPSLSQYLPIYTATFNDFVRRQLKYESVLTYEVLSDKVRPWRFGEEGTGYLSVVDELRSAMARNPFLKVMFASGYYDLATPYFATWYTINHLDLGRLRDNITETIYSGGHMMYHYPPVLEQLHDDVAKFVRAAVR